MRIEIADIDFETKRIQKRPVYPPVPVGVAIGLPGKRPEYMAWGHPTQNNCTRADAVRKLRDIYKKYRLCFHNAKFDLEVGEAHMGLPLIPPKGFDDTMLLAFLRNPREFNLKLKPLAERWLDLPPDEQEELRDWIIAHIPEARKAKTKWGEYISEAPGKLAGKYAKGDIIRTKGLRNEFYSYVADNGMLPQYEIEKRTIIEAIYMEREGVPIDYATLEPDLKKAKQARRRHEAAIQKVLGDINLNSPKQKVEAFERLGLVDEWEYGEETATGQVNPKTGIDSLMRVCNDIKLVKHLDMFSRYDKIIGTYMEPWLESALENNGRFFPWFNTIKGDNDKGTYTGRFSSNFQQVPRAPKKEYKTLPFLRDYIIADKSNHILFNRDFSQQELRILAHFEDGIFLAAYQEDPTLDAHNWVRDEMEYATGREYDRSEHVKPCNFLLVYGGGAPALSRNIECSMVEARGILKAHGKALPGVKDLKDDLSDMAARGETFKTAGGRIYDFEPGFEYVALNTLIQGSAADHTKRALLSISDMLRAENYDARIMLTVHDEFMLSGPKRQKRKLMAHFKEAMEYDELFDVKMLSDGKIGERWGKMEKVK